MQIVSRSSVRPNGDDAPNARTSPRTADVGVVDGLIGRC